MTHFVKIIIIVKNLKKKKDESPAEIRTDDPKVIVIEQALNSNLFP